MSANCRYVLSEQHMVLAGSEQQPPMKSSKSNTKIRVVTKILFGRKSKLQQQLSYTLTLYLSHNQKSILPELGAKKQPYKTNHRNLVRSICTRIENVTNFRVFYKVLILKGLWNMNFAEFVDNGLLGCMRVVVVKS